MDYEEGHPVLQWASTWPVSLQGARHMSRSHGIFLSCYDQCLSPSVAVQCGQPTYLFIRLQDVRGRVEVEMVMWIWSQGQDQKQAQERKLIQICVHGVKVKLTGCMGMSMLIIVIILYKQLDVLLGKKLLPGCGEQKNNSILKDT